VRLINADALEGLRTLPDGIADMCVTSPPYYGLRNYGIDGQIGLEKTPKEHIEKLVDVFREVRRVLRDDGTLWVNYGDTYLCQQGSGFNGNKRLDAANRSIQVKRPLPPKNLLGMPWRLAFALQSDGWILRQDIIWHKPNPIPESVTDRCTKAHEYLFLLSKSARYYFDSCAIKEQAATIPKLRDKNAEGYQADYAKSNRFSPGERVYGADFMRNKRSVWSIPTRPYPAAHFATFPPDLIRPCILAGSREGGIVLDPFFGSGTTGEVCIEEGRECIGIELNPEYIRLAGGRVGKARHRPKQMNIQFEKEET